MIGRSNYSGFGFTMYGTQLKMALKMKKLLIYWFKKENIKKLTLAKNVGRFGYWFTCSRKLIKQALIRFISESNTKQKLGLHAFFQHLTPVK